MITRFRVNGFKNLMDVDLRLGAFNCVAGPNGVGKSNLFDAIRFLGATASLPLVEAASAIRESGKPGGDGRHIFSLFDKRQPRTVEFEVEMIVPWEAEDEFGVPAKGAQNFLVYHLVLEERADDPVQIGIKSEQLTHHPWSEHKDHLFFEPSRTWIDSVKRTSGAPRSGSFIYTEKESGKIFRRQEGRAGRPAAFSRGTLPRTVLSSANAQESPTALCAKNELREWRILALEASKLRTIDTFNSPSSISENGEHMAATLRRLVSMPQDDGTDVSAVLVNRLRQLVEDVEDIRVEEDPVRETLTLLVTDRRERRVRARELSDGTLRFLALAVMELDPKVKGLVCLEEPENGIHPQRIRPMLSLLNGLAMDVKEALSSSNPLRQVIVNTHSPGVVAEVADKDLIIAFDQLIDYRHRVVQAPVFGCLADTWRAKVPNAVKFGSGAILPYLSPILPPNCETGGGDSVRVADRPEFQELLPWGKP